MAPRRIFNNNNNNNNGGRVVTLGGGGGLNERFSQLDKSKKQPPTSSVFSRIRGSGQPTGPAGRRTTNIQSRLNKPVAAGIRKRTGPTPMQGVERSGRGRNAVTKGRGRVNTQFQQRGNQSNRGKQPQRGAARGARGGRGTDKGRKPVSAQDLDKSLDDYMMKDPKTAQSRLDAELNSYMDDAGDVLMDL